MMYLSQRFLSKFNIYGNDLARYAIPYYALARGLEVSFKNISNIESLSSFYKVEGNGGFYEIKSGDTVFEFNYSRLLKNGQSAEVEKCNKGSLGSYLAELGLKAPFSRKYSIKTEPKIILKDCLEFPLVVKPVVGTMGKGVYPNLKNEKDLLFAIEKQKSSFLVEKHISGDEYRIYTVGGKAVAFCKRVSPNVVGDGVSDIKKLIDKKNKYKQSKRVQSIRVNQELVDFLGKNGLGLDSVPSEGELVFLSYKRGRSDGGDITTISTGVPASVVAEIEKLAGDLSDSYFLGIDCVVNGDDLTVLEVNFRPQITSALLPDSGEPVDLPRLIVDGLFGKFFGELHDPVDFKSYLVEVGRQDSLEWEEMRVINNRVLLALTS